jgi:hypothetical protein
MEDTSALGTIFNSDCPLVIDLVKGFELRRQSLDDIARICSKVLFLRLLLMWFSTDISCM